MNLNDFKARWSTIHPDLLIERDVTPVFENPKVKSLLVRRKIIAYSLMIAFFLIGVVLIIAGGAEQKHHNIMIPLIVVGLILSVIVTLSIYTFWLINNYRKFKEISKQAFNREHILQIYLKIFKNFPFFQCHTQDTFVDPDGFVVLGGLADQQKFKVVSSKRDLRFFLDQKLVLLKNTNLHHWNTDLTLQISILDPLRMQTQEAFIQTITRQIKKNLEVILSNLFSIYGDETQSYA